MFGERLGPSHVSPGPWQLRACPVATSPRGHCTRPREPSSSFPSYATCFLTSELRLLPLECCIPTVLRTAPSPLWAVAPSQGLALSSHLSAPHVPPTPFSPLSPVPPSGQFAICIHLSKADELTRPSAAPVRGCVSPAAELPELI